MYKQYWYYRHIQEKSGFVYKKRKVPGTSKTVKTGKGTNTDHFLIFLKNILDAMDKEGMKGYYAVMDNVRIHDNSRVPAYIEA